MNYLSVNNLSKTYGDKPLFDSVSFGLQKGDKLALIANNGSGKSTLLKVLAGMEMADDGDFAFQDGLRVAYLEQQPVFPSGISVKEVVQTHESEIKITIQEYEDALKQQSLDNSAQNRQRVAFCTNKMDKLDAWDYERRMGEMLTRFGISDLEQSTDTLSGGQNKRLALSLCLLDNPELLLLDEPTNHMDLEMIEWLEKYLSASDLTLLMVTHDRYFLDRVCNQILEIEQGQAFLHKGNYGYFLEKKAQRMEAMQTERDKSGKRLKQELEWLRRMPKARTHKSKARIDAYYETKEKLQNVPVEQELVLQNSMSRQGGKIIEAHHLYKQYGDLNIIDNFNYLFKKGERIGIIGKNGVGKSTFLNLLTGAEKPDSGEVVIGDTTVIGYYTQTGLDVKEDQTVLEVVKDIAEVFHVGKTQTMTASQFLNYFLFPPKVQMTPVSKLSGGELRRLHLLTVLIKNPNFLILDEPTNDLDILTLNKMEEFLSDFKGCLLLVSHDRYFLNRLTEHLFVFEGDGKIKDLYGNYNDYKALKEQEERELRKQQAKEKEPVVRKAKSISKKLSFNEKREYEMLEKEIEKLEQEKTVCEEVLNSGTTDYEKLEEASSRVGEIMELLDEKTLRWLELDERNS